MAHTSVNISDWISEQFPEFIRSEYPRMVEFAQKYYEYIDTETLNNKIEHVKDIDLTDEEYLLKIRKEFSYNAAKFDFLSDRNFIRHAKEFYSSKGSDESIKFLFRVMFNDNVEIEYPADRIFAPSSSHWQQLKSIKVNISPGSVSPEEFIGNFLTIRNSQDIRQAIEIDIVRDLTDKNSEEELSTIFEIFFPTEIFIDVQIGDVLIGTTSAGGNFNATIIPSLSSVKVLFQGKDFRIGQVIQLDGVTGTGAVGVISGVTSSGGVKNVKILKFGKNYNNNFYVDLIPEGVFAEEGTMITSSKLGSDIQQPIEDSQSSYKERIDNLVSDYVLNDSLLAENNYGSSTFYSHEQFTGQFTEQFRSTQEFFQDKISSALIYCSTGPISTYPGFFIDNRGAASDYSVLQDGKYYQSFSYKIKSNHDIAFYRDILTTFVHPAGLKMFSEYSIDNKLDLASQIEMTDVFNINIADYNSTFQLDILTISGNGSQVTITFNEQTSPPFVANEYAEIKTKDNNATSNWVNEVDPKNNNVFEVVSCTTNTIVLTSTLNVTDDPEVELLLSSVKELPLNSRQIVKATAYAAFPISNDLISAPTNNYFELILSGNLTLINNLEYVSSVGEESVKVYGFANVRAGSFTGKRISGTASMSVTTEVPPYSIYSSLQITSYCNSSVSVSSSATATLSNIEPTVVMDFLGNTYGL